MADRLIKQLAKLHEDISWEDDDDDTFEPEEISVKYLIFAGDYAYQKIQSLGEAQQSFSTISQSLTFMIEADLKEYNIAEYHYMYLYNDTVGFICQYDTYEHSLNFYSKGNFLINEKLGYEIDGTLKEKSGKMVGGVNKFQTAINAIIQSAVYSGDEYTYGFISIPAKRINTIVNITMSAKEVWIRDTLDNIIGDEINGK